MSARDEADVAIGLEEARRLNAGETILIDYASDRYGVDSSVAVALSIEAIECDALRGAVLRAALRVTTAFQKANESGERSVQVYVTDDAASPIGRLVLAARRLEEFEALFERRQR